MIQHFTLVLIVFRYACSRAGMRTHSAMKYGPVRTECLFPHPRAELICGPSVALVITAY